MWVDLPPDGSPLCIPRYALKPLIGASPLHQHQKNLQVLQILLEKDPAQYFSFQTPRQPWAPWASWELTVLRAPKHQILRKVSNFTPISQNTQKSMWSPTHR